VGGIGIMNIMLVSVTERTREIGLRLAVSARGRDVGVALGFGSALAISDFAQWRTVIAPATIALAFGFAAAIGIFFGFYPARKAARLNPIEALRYRLVLGGRGMARHRAGRTRYPARPGHS
jgi:putative ABC transport system permease protein